MSVLRLVTVFAAFFSIQCMAASKLVFMREFQDRKQIILKEGEKEAQLTDGDLWHLYPDLTADGRKVVWVQGPNETDLAVTLYDLESKSLEQWSLPTKGMSLQPRFSKDGKKIFFSAVTKDGNKIAQFEPAMAKSKIIAKVKGAPTVYELTPTYVPHEGQGYFPRPSSDGMKIYFQRNLNSKKEIVEYSYWDKKTRVLVEGMAPALSLDEQWIAYTTKQSGNWDIWKVQVRTGERIQVTAASGDEMAPTFKPDGRLAFAANRTGKFQIYGEDGSSWVELAPSTADDYAPQFAGDSSYRQELLPNLLGPLRSSFGAVEHMGRIFLCGGHAGSEHTYPPESFTDVFQVFYKGQWRELAPRPHKSHGFQLAAYGNYIYAFGGFAYEGSTKPKWKSIDAIDRYNIATNNWETIGRLPRKRSSNALVTVNEKVYLFGGWDATPKKAGDFEGTFHSAIDVFDLKSEKITTLPWSMPAPLRRAFTATSYNGKILLIGGLGQGSTHFELLSNVTEVDPLNGQTRELTALPFATFAPAAGVLNNKLLVFGGMFKTGPEDYEYVSHVYSLDLKANDKWAHTGRFLKETKGFSQVVRFHEGLAVLGGHHYYGDRDEPVSTFEMFLNSKD